MKRHMKLIARILRYVEENGNGASLEHPEVEGYSPIQVSYHVNLCVEAGFLNTSVLISKTTKKMIETLTWKGHEFLDANRNLLA